jgi:hypothetical protein
MGDKEAELCEAELLTMHPDLGMALWERGARATVQVVVGTRWDVIHDYGEYREITGALYDVPISDRSENPLGAYCVTLRTKQTEAELSEMVDLARRDADYQIAASAVVSADIEEGQSGERYRVLVGKLMDTPKPDAEAIALARADARRLRRNAKRAEIAGRS